MAERVPRVLATQEARTALQRLRRSLGSVVVMQPAGCCSGAAPLVLPARDLSFATSDVRVGAIDAIPVYITRRGLNAWEHGDLELDVEPGDAGRLSLAPAQGQHFVTRSRPMVHRSAEPRTSAQTGTTTGQ